jgi:ABC-type transport system involved in cytochrome bd biosynthesis fused ATPase/permease subunit
LKELSLTLKAGDRVLMTGVSGQGKSTLLEVTAGMLPPTQGEVLLNDKPLNADIFRAMRHRISLISPEFFLFEDTIASNLNLGRPEELSNVLLAEAIERAKLTQLVSTLPDGADTNIGANGAALSLGERQRLILAHLYVKHPDLLLLDEATANLDPALEAEVISELQAYIPKESIVLMVAHKPPQNFQFNLHYQVKAGQLHLIKDSREPSAAAQ